MAEILSTISTVSFVISAIAFALAVFLWFKFKIPMVYGDLSGRNARRSIEQMREHNARSGGKVYRPSTENIARGKLTSTMDIGSAAGQKKKTEKKSERKTESDNVVETGILAENRSDFEEAEDTSILIENENETMLLPENAVRRVGGKKLVMLDEVMLIHTEEVIDLDHGYGSY